ncbi:hypothetical protein E2C01_020674 [Portunus trituberculatus]|uniref:Uncharacterized protein n=1 Tax=Portunus trituberculatus TaxID=210409 RepID=A0A5B7E436_PORTR|nr:hypothetical protein [Portunus trituberculatus]
MATGLRISEPQRPEEKIMAYILLIHRFRVSFHCHARQPNTWRAAVTSVAWASAQVMVMVVVMVVVLRGAARRDGDGDEVDSTLIFSFYVLKTSRHVTAIGGSPGDLRGGAEEEEVERKEARKEGRKIGEM